MDTNPILYVKYAALIIIILAALVCLLGMAYCVAMLVMSSEFKPWLFRLGAFAAAAAMVFLLNILRKSFLPVAGIDYK